MDEVEALEEEFVLRENPCGTTHEFQVLFEDIMEQEGLDLPTNSNEALDLYAVLVNLDN
jgi:hypothetical protein